MFNQLQIHDGNGCQDHFLDKILNNFSVNEKKNTGLDSRARQTPIIVSTEQIKVPNKNLITSACVGLALTEIKAFFFTAHLSPPTAKGFLWSWLCQSCASEWAELCKPKARTLKNSLRRTRTWLLLPHSFLHQEFTEVWLCISFFFFLLEPFPARLGITRPSITCPSELWMGKPQTGLQSCPSAQGNYTPTVSSLNTA